MSKLTDTFHKAHKSTFGYNVGDNVGFSYRSAKNPKGTIVSTEPGSTRKTAEVHIRPDAADRHTGETATITRHVDKIHHVAALNKPKVKK